MIYWVATNTISMVQAGFLKIPRIKKAVGMPTLIKHDISKASIKGSSKGFINEMKECEYCLMYICIMYMKHHNILENNTLGKLLI